MGIFDFFKKDKEDEIDPLKDLTLDKLQVGYFVDFDLSTWEVTGYNIYDWGDGDVSREWQLSSSEELLYLEKESDDEDYWSLNKKISFADLDPVVKKTILEKSDPPDVVVFEGVSFYIEEMAGGHFLKGGQGTGTPLLRWGYVDEEGGRLLGIEQWGDNEFEASTGIPVEEYQFTNILPRKIH
ncbi:MAG: DUF4178 domain-containing protein [Pseudomonadota bacterium]